MPAGDGLTFAYGDYSFDPRPLFTVNKEIIKTASNTGLATKYSMTLNGTILPTGIDLNDSKGGITTVLSGINDLRTAFNTDFNLLLLQCDDEPALQLSNIVIFPLAVAIFCLNQPMNVNNPDVVLYKNSQLSETAPSAEYAVGV